MRITKRQLRRIIKEEKRKLHEQTDPFQDLMTSLKQAEKLAELNDPGDEDARGH